MAANPIMILLAVLVGTFALFAAAYLGVKVAGGVFRAVGWVVAHIWRFVSGVVGDTARLVGALLVLLALAPLTVLNVVIGRWSAAAHFGRGVQSEAVTMGRLGYRVLVGHPLRLLLLGDVVEGIEQRLPAAVAKAPGGDKPSKRSGVFEGYVVEGSLKGGGSGGRLYIAKPDDAKRAQLERGGVGAVDRVVIKSFSLLDGSSMPQIVRESRALEAARKLGLVLEHEMGDERFYYVMRYVPGETLGEVAGRMHAGASSEGLGTRDLRAAVGYVADLVRTLDGYHRGGLWHKDVKPDNVIVHDGRAELVDLGLVTPLRSAMTLTTHGTEYFRDPELVRMAMRGAKVHEVDGSLFDIYGAGAVLYSVIENSFPAHGALSRVTKRCPEALKWIVRRSMADLNRRYPSAAEMLEDLRVVASAEDPWALKPKDLPSVRGGGGEASRDGGGFGDDAGADNGFGSWVDERRAATPAGVGAGAGPGMGAGAGAGEAAPAQAGGGVAVDAAARKPRIVVTDWLTGGYTYDPVGGEAGGGGGESVMRHGPARRVTPDIPAELRPGAGGNAREQVKRARERARLSQKRVQDRMSAYRDRSTTRPNAGVFGAVVLVIAGFGVAMWLLAERGGGSARPVGDGGSPPAAGTVLKEGSAWAGVSRLHGQRPIAWAVPMFGGAEVGGDEPLSDAAQLLGDEGVLVIARRGNAVLPESEWGVLDRLVERLRRDGVSLAGDGMLEPATGEVAELLTGVGAGGVGDEGDRAWVRAWLGDHPGFAAVLWSEGDGESRTRVVIGEDEGAAAAVQRSLEAWTAEGDGWEWKSERPGAPAVSEVGNESRSFNILIRRDGEERLVEIPDVPRLLDEWGREGQTHRAEIERIIAEAMEDADLEELEERFGEAWAEELEEKLERLGAPTGAGQ